MVSFAIEDGSGAEFQLCAVQLALFERIEVRGKRRDFRWAALREGTGAANKKRSESHEAQFVREHKRQTADRALVFPIPRAGQRGSRLVQIAPDNWEDR